MLIAAIRAGDDQAFEQLYNRYRRRIGGYVARLVGDAARAEDVTQEVFLSALRRMRATDQPIAFRPWVHEIARNAAIDHHRRDRRWREVPLPAEDTTRCTQADSALESRQKLDHLRGAFGGLSESHRRLIVLRELEGRSYDEISSHLGMSIASVESALFRARRRLATEYRLLAGEA